MTLGLPAHGESRVHVHVMAGEVQADQHLEDHAVGRLGGREEDEQAGRRAAVRHHVQHRAEPRALPELARREAVERVE